MRIAVVGRGNVGGGLADLWERAGHQVTRIGRDGGDVSDAEAVLLAVPGGVIAEALDKLRGIEGKTVIDATNLFGVAPPAGFSSTTPTGSSRSGTRRSGRSASSPAPSPAAWRSAPRRRRGTTCFFRISGNSGARILASLSRWSCRTVRR